MNKPAIEQLIQQYRTDPAIIFQMSEFAEVVPCGTACCYAGQIAVNQGFALHLLEPDRPRLLFPANIDGKIIAFLDIAEAALDLTSHQSKRLFFRHAWPRQFQYLPDTPALAADRLQHFLDTDGAE